MKGYRTLIINGLAALGTALSVYLGTPEVKEAFSAHPEALVIGLAVLNVALRFITTSPVGQK